MTWTLQMYKPSSECKLKDTSHKFLHKTTSFETPVCREYVISLASGPHLFPCQSSIFLISIRLSGKICPVLQNLHPPVPRKERGRSGTKGGEREVWYQGRGEGGLVPREGGGRSGTKGGEREVWHQGRGEGSLGPNAHDGVPHWR